jgi:hypothetical protein
MFRGSHRERARFAIKKRIEGLCWVTFPGGGEEILDCVIDTGAGHTTIPQRFWSNYISPQEADKLPKQSIRGAGGLIDVRVCTVSLKVSGRSDLSTDPFDLGECTVWLALDRDAAEDAAKKGQKPMQMRQVLFGAGGGSLDKGGVCINWKEREVYYIEVDDVDAAIGATTA